MNGEQALELFRHLIQVAIFIAGPVLGASLVAGVSVGVLQAAIQVNEASISFIVKVTTVILVIVALGPMLVAREVDYARSSFVAIEHVVH